MKFLYCIVFILSLLACRSKAVLPSVKSGLDLSKYWQPNPFSSRLLMETSLGEMKIELFFEPSGHREQFLNLVADDFYNGLLFHRSIKGFMIQGGDPESRAAGPEKRLGGGGLDYDLAPEISSRYLHFRGALAAARQGDEVNPQRRSSACQFYLVQGSRVDSAELDRIERLRGFSYTSEQRALYGALGGAPQLDLNYTVFGRVYEGLEVLDRLLEQPTDANDRPKQDLKILSIRVLP